MAKVFRIAGLAALALVAGAGAYLIFFQDSKGDHVSPLEKPAYPQPVDNSSCAECHPEIFKQWESSYHKLAWDDPQVDLPGLRLKEDSTCWSCHIPEPLLLSGLGKLPQARSVRRSDGIDCISCHYTTEGMAGRADSDAPPCRPRKSDDVKDLRLCEGCHNQHKTHDEWRSSKYHPETGCNDCHMELVEGVATKGKAPKKYRSHSFPGAHDLAFLAKAITMTVAVEDGSMVVELVNDGAGHNFPTDARHHLARLEVDIVNEKDERLTDQFSDWYRNQYRNEIPSQNRQIKPGEKKTYRAPLKAGTGFLRARLLFCLQPTPAGVSDRLEGAMAVILQEKKVRIGE